MLYVDGMQVMNRLKGVFGVGNYVDDDDGCGCGDDNDDGCCVDDNDDGCGCGVNILLI